ncbi:hypothetical protein CspeluHIS016_0208390 [Cutaneotrichosporon spelunceum]|uniref:Uncharacterized protein n=1 Tax=Cutaneotrichosporon spelunceum TaxID=1672016 RepID=A0AAD3TRS7_9TREE|nr:hypothetical protein CspeluHIS016_0208390 [Cutaneotrichosporon spelunceum]
MRALVFLPLLLFVSAIPNPPAVDNGTVAVSGDPETAGHTVLGSFKGASGRGGGSSGRRGGSGGYAPYLYGSASPQRPSVVTAACVACVAAVIAAV